MHGVGVWREVPTTTATMVHVTVLLPPRTPPWTVMATVAAVDGGGARGRRRDWRVRCRSLAGGADNDGNDGNDGDKGNAWVVICPVCCRPPPPARPPSDGGGRRGWREGVSSRLAHGVITGTATTATAKTTVMW